MKSLKELKEELSWLETTPFYLGKDGYPLPFFLFPGLLPLFVYKQFRKIWLRKKIKELS